MPRELSGGMQQRLILVMHLMLERKFYFFDEPFSSLDRRNVDTMSRVSPPRFVRPQMHALRPFLAAEPLRLHASRFCSCPGLPRRTTGTPPRVFTRCLSCLDLNRYRLSITRRAKAGVANGARMADEPHKDQAEVPGNKPPDQQEFMESVDTRFKKMEELLAKTGSAGTGNGPGVIASFLSGGLFFLLLGGGLIFMAQAYMATNHAGITFVWVVLGVALMLYGTGTQGMGQFNSGAGYNVAIAGGAGVVAFAVAFGIIEYSGKMRDAFQPERKFVRVLIQGGDGVTDVTQYATAFEMDGVPVPAAKKGRNVEVFVPYLPFEISKVDQSNQPKPEQTTIDDKGMCPTPENREAARKLDPRATLKLISADFFRVQAGSNPDALLSSAKAEFVVRLDERIFRSNDGGIDYPSYPVRICVNLQQVERAKELITTARLVDTGNPSTKTLKANLPPALIEAQ